jgi:hypothetical protein
MVSEVMWDLREIIWGFGGYAREFEGFEARSQRFCGKIVKVEGDLWDI